MTYNTHGCVGTDGVIDPGRIAEVIVRAEPDVVCLQELDVRRPRSAFVDQAEQIAAQLEMTYHFYPSFRVGEGGYGNAVLSRWPMRIVRAGGLPRRRKRHEPRGALWVEVEDATGWIQVITTHLGLSGLERRRQVNALCGRRWLGSVKPDEAVVFCGDFNFSRRSSLYRRLRRGFSDARETGRGSLRTWPSRWPLVALDHVLISDQLSSVRAWVEQGGIAKVASDHLPLIVDLRREGSHDCA